MQQTAHQIKTHKVAITGLNQHKECHKNCHSSMFRLGSAGRVIFLCPARTS